MKALAFIGAVIGLAADVAQASGAVADLGLFYSQTSVANPQGTDGAGNYVQQSSTSETTIDADLLLGYQFGNGAVVGLQYLQQSVKYDIVLAGSDSYPASSTATAIGPAVGYMQSKGGFGGVVSYLLMPSYTANLPALPGIPSGSVKLTGTSGMCLGFGYLFDLGSFRVGPWLDYESVVYTKATITGNPVLSSAYVPGQSVRASGSIPAETVTTISPLVVFGVDL